jgi:hypothetical protein
MPDMPIARWFVIGLTLAWAAGGEARATPTTSFTVSGNVAQPGSYDAGALRALPSTTETASYLSGGSPVTDTFTGPTLWNVLQAAGGIVNNPANKNDLLRQYIVATGSDGYKAVITAGEIAPRFGNKLDLVAVSDSAGKLPNPDGFARTVAYGDVAGGRYVSNLADLRVGTAPSQSGIGGGTTSQFTIGGAVSSGLTYIMSTLTALTPHTETVTYLSGATSVTDTFTGALLWDVLNSAGILTNSSIKNDILRKVVAATGSDGYEVAFSLGELSPNFGNEPILVAYSDTAGQIAAGDGFARIIVPGDIAGGRYVSNLSSLTVFDATTVPEPSAFGLLLVGLAGMLVLQRSRRMKAAPGATR